VPALRDQAAARRGVAGSRLDETRDALLAATVAGYARVGSLAAVVAAHRRRLAALGEERGRVEQLFAVGRAAEVDRKRVAAAVAGAEAERVRLTSALDLAERDLARLAGWPVEALRANHLAPLPAPLADGAESPLDREVFAAAALAANPRLAAARGELAAAETAIRLVTSEKRPRLGVRGGYQEYGTAGGFETGEWQAALELTVPIWDGGRVAARESRARAERDAAAAELAVLRGRVLAEVDAALADVERLRAQAAAYAEAVASQREVTRVEALRLGEGVGTETDYLGAEAALVAAEASLAEVRFAELTARAALARTCGGFAVAGLGLEALAAVESQGAEKPVVEEQR
jgi:outer membrane protein TolC